MIEQVKIQAQVLVPLVRALQSELGSADFSLAEGFAGVALTRTQTIMQGADHCDFRFKRK